MTKVLGFMKSKQFNYIDIEEEDIIPLLISAAAVQLTFGLQHFKMDYFENIFVVKNIYTYGLYNRPFEGHASEDVIFFYGKNF